MTTKFTFDLVAFRAAYPQFVNPPFTDAMLNGYWDSAGCFIDNTTACGWLQGECRLQALNLMTAHIAQIFNLVNSGQTPGQINSATIDKVTVSMTMAPNTNPWQWWLGLTPYGAMLLALLQASSVGGFYIGGVPEIPGFRKAFGVF